MPRNESRGFPVLAVVASAVLTSTTACLPLPISHMSRVTPPVTGVLRRDDGRPIAGVVVRASGRDDDQACRRAGARDTTDARGEFRLPAFEERRRVFWLTMMENFGRMSYWLCARPADSLATSHGDLRSSVSGRFVGDSVLCLRWGQATERLTCEALPARHRIVEGGSWSDGGTSGSYRILLADADETGYASLLAVQWIDSSTTPGPGRVRATIESPAGETVAPWPAPRILECEGRWYVATNAVERTKWGNTRRLVLELGAPGVARVLPDSTRKRLFLRVDMDAPRAAQTHC